MKERERRERAEEEREPNAIAEDERAPLANEEKREREREKRERREREGVRRKAPWTTDLVLYKVKRNSLFPPPHTHTRMAPLPLRFQPH